MTQGTLSPAPASPAPVSSAPPHVGPGRAALLGFRSHRLLGGVAQNLRLISLVVATWGCLSVYLPVAYAQNDAGGDTFADTKIRLKFEPVVSDTMRAALKYFRVDPANFDRLRRTANTRALLPTFAAGYRLDSTAADKSNRGQDRGAVTSLNEDSGNRINTFSMGFVWDLRELIFNPAEVQVYGLIGVQRDLMLETTRIFYLRRQLFVRFLNNPPRDPLAREALSLRVDEFTALLDVLTGGWFSEETDRRMARAGRGKKKRRKGRAGARDAQTSIRSSPRKPRSYQQNSMRSPAIRSRFRGAN